MPLSVFRKLFAVSMFAATSGLAMAGPGDVEKVETANAILSLKAGSGDRHLAH